MSVMTKLRANSERLKPIAVGVSILALLGILTYWGGSPAPGPMFVVGVVGLIAIVFIFAFLIWWFLMSPLPAKQQVPASLGSRAQRQILAILVGISGMCFVVGGFWDEIWHRLYGIPFGDDFFWRPHLLMYFSLMLIGLFAIGGLLTIVMRGKGNLRQRFRAQPLVGLLILIAGFQVVTVPLDPLWHTVYGDDLSAWSLPHIILVLGYTANMLTAIAIQRSLLQGDSWAALSKLTVRGFYVLILLGLITLINLQLNATEWDSLRSLSEARSTFLSRPQWLFPVIIVTYATFMGTLVLRILRRAGVATAMGLVTIIMRLALLNSFVDVNISVKPYVLLLPSLIALDVWYWLRLRRNQHMPDSISSGVVAAVAMFVIGLPMIAQTMIYPVVNLNTLPGMLVIGLGMALAGCWAGAELARWMVGFYPQQTADVADDSATPGRVMWLPVGIFVAAVLFVIFFIGTASPPVT